MNDVVNYFIGMLEIIFSYINPIWRTEKDLQIAFVIICSVFCLCVLFCCFQIITRALSAFFNFYRGV